MWRCRQYATIYIDGFAVATRGHFWAFEPFLAKTAAVGPKPRAISTQA